MSESTTPSRVLDTEARRFLRRTGVAVILVEIAVLAGVWFFQQYFGR